MTMPEGKLWSGKGVRLEKAAGGATKLCLMPDEPGAEARCFSTDKLTDEDAEVLAYLLSELDAVEYHDEEEEAPAQS